MTVSLSFIPVCRPSLLPLIRYLSLPLSMWWAGLHVGLVWWWRWRWWCVEVSESASPCARGKRPRVCSKTPACLKHADVFNAHASRSTHKTTHRTHFAAHTDQHTTTHTHTNMRSPHTPQTIIDTHITNTRSRNGPSMRVPRVMLNTSFGSHVSSRVCGSFAVNFGTGRQSLLHASAVGCANSGSPAGLCSDLPCDVQVFSFPSRRWFACLTTILSSWCDVSVSANPWCVQHGGSAGDVSSGRDAGRDSEE